MSKIGRGQALGALLALGLALGAGVARALDDEDDKKIAAAQKDVLDLAKAVAENKKDVADKAKAIQKKYEELNTVMHGYKPSTKKGIGTKIGPPGPGDGIEFKLINLGKRALSPAALSKEKDALTRVAYINIAIAEITNHYPPTKKIANGPAKWKQHNEDQKKAARELIEALKSNTPANVKKAAENLNNACNNCHMDFRDVTG